MKKHHYTIVLAILFLTGLIILWWAPDTEIDPNVSDAILPARARSRSPTSAPGDRPVGGGAREGGGQGQGPGGREPDRIVVERREEGPWQMLEPIDAEADPSLVETLVRNLKDMRKSLDSGTIHDCARDVRVVQPSSIVKVYGDDPKVRSPRSRSASRSASCLIDRPKGGKGIEVIDPRMLSMLSLAPRPATSRCSTCRRSGWARLPSPGPAAT